MILGIYLLQIIEKKCSVTTKKRKSSMANFVNENKNSKEVAYFVKVSLMFCPALGLIYEINLYHFSRLRQENDQCLHPLRHVCQIRQVRRLLASLVAHIALHVSLNGNPSEGKRSPPALSWKGGFSTTSMKCPQNDLVIHWTHFFSIPNRIYVRMWGQIYKMT